MWLCLQRLLAFKKAHCEVYFFLLYFLTIKGRPRLSLLLHFAFPAFFLVTERPLELLRRAYERCLELLRRPRERRKKRRRDPLDFRGLDFRGR